MYDAKLIIFMCIIIRVTIKAILIFIKDEVEYRLHKY
jgi:hypothetical protein